jgi:hypothetical protein
MRIDAFRDLRLLCRRLDDLLYSSRRIGQVPVGLKQIARLAISQMSLSLLRQFREDRHVAALSALSFVNEDHQLIEEQILDTNPGKLGDACSCLKERLD